MLTFRDCNRSFRSDGDLSETTTTYDFNVRDHNLLRLNYQNSKSLRYDT